MIAALGVISQIFSTHFGPGIGGDATIYITSARNLLAGQGLGLITANGNFRLLPYFPPLYPLVLACFGLFGSDLVIIAKVLNIILFGIFIWLIGFVTYLLKRSATFSVLAAFLVATSPVLVPVFSWAMAEPLAMVLGFGSMAFLIPVLQQPRNSHHRWRLWAGITAGLSMLTRYSNLAFPLTGAIGLWVLSGQGIRRKLVDAILYLSISALPTAIWLVIDLLSTSTISSRAVESSLGMTQRLISLSPALREVFLFWLVPDSWVSSPPYPKVANTVFVIAGILVLITWMVIVFRSFYIKKALSKVDPGLQFTILLFVFILVYLVVISAVYIVTYPPITIGSRMLSPVHVAVLWLIVMLAILSLEISGAKLVEGSRLHFLPGMILVSLFFVVGWYGWRSLRIVQQNYALGLGFNSLAWQHSPTIQVVRGLPEDAILVTNEEMAILFLTGRRAYPMMEIYLSRPLDETSFPDNTLPRFGESEVPGDTGQQLFHQGRALLVLFNSISDQLQSIYGNHTSDRVRSMQAGLKVIFCGEDGCVYGNP